ncbi:MAG TPA: hypothetical protein VK816_03445 [Jatrophihabitantaceae bacterium]|nr:hypothetical protein [Jatrophihabitantaceae bacterium]
MEPVAIKNLAGSLRHMRDNLMPVAGAQARAGSDFGATRAVVAAGEFSAQVDSVLLTLAGQLDFLQAAADHAVAVWLATEDHIAASFQASAGSR